MKLKKFITSLKNHPNRDELNKVIQEYIQMCDKYPDEIEDGYYEGDNEKVENKFQKIKEKVEKAYFGEATLSYLWDTIDSDDVNDILDDFWGDINKAIIKLKA